MKRTFFQTAIIIFSVLGLCSCEHKELCYDHPHSRSLLLNFDWSYAPDATPEGMCVYFYPIDDDLGGVRRFDFADTAGGQIQLRVGRYRVVCYNNDTDGVLFDGMDDYFTHHCYTRDGDLMEPIYGNGSYNASVPRAAEAEEERVVICPDMMWGCSVAEVKVEDISTAGGSQTEQVITLTPQELVCTYTFEIRNVSNLKHVSQLCASLSGMAGGLTFSTNKLYTECVTLPFEAKSDGESTITGSFYTFGHHELNLRSHHLTLYVIMDDGQKYVYGTTGQHFNVTNQVHTAQDKRHVHIVVDGLDLPQPITDDGGMKPTVDDWQEINEDILI